MWRFSCGFILIVYLAIAKTDGQYRYDYSYNKEAGGWLKFHRVPATFTEAFFRCKLEGAVLASPLNGNLQKAMTVIQEAAENNCAILTGIHATISKGYYTSIEGIPLEKIPLKWAPDEPDNYDDSESCIVMLKNGTVADVRCNDTYPYICYRKKTSVPLITACGTVDPGYNLDHRTGSCYKFHTVGKTWRRAQMTCLAEGGHLAIINSPTEAQVLKELFATKPAAVIKSVYKDSASLGFLDWDNQSSWFTVKGESLEEAGYPAWSNGQPDNAKNAIEGQYCGSMFRTGLLDDVWCDSVPFAFICEKTPDSLIEDFEQRNYYF